MSHLASLVAPPGDGEALAVQRGHEWSRDRAEYGIGVACLADMNLAQTKLVPAAGFDRAAQGRGHHLGAQADAKDRLASRHGIPQVLPLGVQGRKVVVDGHWAAKCHDQVHLVQRRSVERVIGRGGIEDVAWDQLEAVPVQDCAEVVSDCLRFVVPDDHCLFHSALHWHIPCLSHRLYHIGGYRKRQAVSPAME